MYVLGISALYHDSAAAIIKDGIIIAAVQEERFTRVKHDKRLPYNAIDFCIKAAGLNGLDEVDHIIYYDNPILTLDRFIHNATAIKDNDNLINSALTNLFQSRLWIHRSLRKHYGFIGKEDKLMTLEHHLSHAASAFYPSPFEEAAIVTIDGVGEWATTTIGIGENNKIKLLKEIDYPHSLGLLYSTFTSFCGFKVNSGDYKFMGLAPYGEPIYYDVIKEKVITIKDDGSYCLNLEYFDFYHGEYMYTDKLCELFGGPARKAESRITRREMDIAASVQKITEEIILKICQYAKKITGKRNLVMAGGVALNCVANGKIVDQELFDKIWIQPAAGDAGGALGCALYSYYQMTNMERVVEQPDSQLGTYLGPAYTNEEIKHYLDSNNIPYREMADKEEFNATVAELLAKENVVGWFKGKMEFGPRALGGRSILADPRSSTMQSKLNLKIKYRESFRPFAPSVIEERMNDYFDLRQGSPYMLLVGHVNSDRRLPFDKTHFLELNCDDMIPIVNVARSDIPAVTHLDYSARVQSVSNTNEDYYALIKKFGDITGCYVLVNTSFNVRGEPIVCSPEDAYQCFMRTEMDALVLEDCILIKEEQPEWKEQDDWREKYELD